MRVVLSAVLLAMSVMAAPLLASAQTPDPVVDAYEALHDGRPYKAKFTSDSSMTIFGIKLTTSLKGSGYQDSDGDLEGSADMTMGTTGSKTKGSSKLTLNMEYKYFPQDQALYFKFKKLPKELSSKYVTLKANTWYLSDGGESITKMIGRSQLSDENFIAANTKYPAVRFTEKSSTKKEYVYVYSIDETMLPDFLAEHARLTGGPDSSQTPLASSMLASAKGTLRIDKKTSLLKSMTQRIGSGGAMTVDTAASFTFTGSKQVVRPTDAIRSDIADGVLGGM